MLELLQEAVLLSAEKLRIINDLLLNKLNRHSSETRMLTNIMLGSTERPFHVREHPPHNSSPHDRARPADAP